MRRVNGVLQGRQPAMDPCHGDPFPADGENVEARFVPVSELPPMSPRFHRLVERALSEELEAAFIAP